MYVKNSSILMNTYNLALTYKGLFWLRIIVIREHNWCTSGPDDDWFSQMSVKISDLYDSNVFHDVVIKYIF